MPCHAVIAEQGYFFCVIKSEMGGVWISGAAIASGKTQLQVVNHFGKVGRFLNHVGHDFALCPSVGCRGFVGDFHVE